MGCTVDVDFAALLRFCSFELDSQFFTGLSEVHFILRQATGVLRLWFPAARRRQMMDVHTLIDYWTSILVDLPELLLR